MALSHHRVVFLASRLLVGNGRDVEAWVSDQEHIPQLEEVAESPGALNLPQRVSSIDWVAVVVVDARLDELSLKYGQLHLAIIAWHIDTFIWILAW